MTFHLDKIACDAAKGVCTRLNRDVNLLGRFLLFDYLQMKICDEIKQNESELANIDLGYNSIQFPLYFIVLSITKMAKSLEPYAQF